MAKISRQAVEEAAALFRKIDAAVSRVAELAKITEPSAFGVIEGGKKEGAPLGGKVSLDFVSIDELVAFKAYYTGLLEQRITRCRHRLEVLGVDSNGGSNA